MFGKLDVQQITFTTVKNSPCFRYKKENSENFKYFEIILRYGFVIKNFGYINLAAVNFEKMIIDEW